MLDWKWSPQQIAATHKRVFPDDPDRHVPHETIYTAICTAIYVQPRGELRKPLVVCLRQGRGTRLPRTRGEDRRGQFPDRVSIHVRPPEVEDRAMPGHWEGDFIKGAGNKSSAGVLVERTNRPVLLAKMDDATAASALAGLSAKLNSCRRPASHDLHLRPRQGDVRHVDLAAQTGVKVYFRAPHSPWQRGTCENTNGLISQQNRARWHRRQPEHQTARYARPAYLRWRCSRRPWPAFTSPQPQFIEPGVALRTWNRPCLLARGSCRGQCAP